MQEPYNLAPDRHSQLTLSVLLKPADSPSIHQTLFLRKAGQDVLHADAGTV